MDAYGGRSFRAWVMVMLAPNFWRLLLIDDNNDALCFCHIMIFISATRASTTA